MFFGFTSNQLCTPKANLGALLRNWFNLMAKHPPLLEMNPDFCEFCKNWQNYFINLIAKVGTMSLASLVTHLCTPKGNGGALFRNWFNLMARHPLIEDIIRFL